MGRISFCVSILLVAFASSATAGVREDVLSGMARCGAIADDHTWLNCLYGAAQPMRSKLGLPPAPANQTALVPASSAAPPDSQSALLSASAATEKKQGGIFSYMFGGEKIIDSMPLASYRFDVRGVFTITLANGQVWRQTDDSRLAHWRGVASSYIASITKGAAGTDNLVIAGDTEYKVRRIQ